LVRTVVDGLTQQRRVTAYYESTQRLYSALWSRHAVHYGLWELGTRDHGESLRNLDRCVAEHLGLPAQARVLDAGCGVGGSSCYIAAAHGQHVVGITLSGYQARAAVRRARRLLLARRPAYLRADFARSPFSDESFDGVIAIESSCHAERKEDFLAEVYRLLRPGGRLVVADGFRAAARPWPGDPRYRALCEGMALTDLAVAAEFATQAEAAGLVLETDRDLTASIMPSAHRIATLSRIGVGICRILRLPRPWLAHGRAGLAQLSLFRDGEISYRLMAARKPDCSRG
jgi:SAM-dependent methyltransferase